MTLTDWIAIGLLLLAVGGAVAYIIKAKKSGRRCIGCPHSKECSANHRAAACGGSCACCQADCKQKQETKEQ